jgi:hypothetical protein
MVLILTLRSADRQYRPKLCSHGNDFCPAPSLAHNEWGRAAVRTLSAAAAKTRVYLFLN